MKNPCREPRESAFANFHKILQNNLSAFGVGGHELLVSRTYHFTVLGTSPFVFNAFASIAGVVAARKTIVLTVKTSPSAAKTIPSAVAAVVSTVTGTSTIAGTICAAAETIFSAVAEVARRSKQARESSRQFLARQK